MEEDKRMGRKKFQFGLTKNARTGTKKPQTSRISLILTPLKIPLIYALNILSWISTWNLVKF